MKLHQTEAVRFLNDRNGNLFKIIALHELLIFHCIRVLKMLVQVALIIPVYLIPVEDFSR